MMIVEALAPPRPATQHPPGCTARMRVLIGDQDGLARRMMRTALNDADGLVVVAAAQDARETLELSRYYRPDVLVIDTMLSPTGCVELIREVQTVSPDTRILTVSADDDEGAVAALRVGSIGHASKDLEPRKLADLVLRAAAGEAIVPRRLVTPLLGLVRGVPDAGWRPVRSRLTTREWEIVDLLRDDASTEQIAEHLVVSITTVYSHVKSVLRKLNVHSRHDAVAVAERLRHEESLGKNAPIATS
jgi:DNA-binding NarL/FixJ family response regulator